jgi:hypothetical protein
MAPPLLTIVRLARSPEASMSGYEEKAAWWVWILSQAKADLAH